MFAYCGNNPLVHNDETGNSWVTDILGLALDAAEGFIDICEKVGSKINICKSWGFSGNASLGVFDFAQSGSVVVDTKGNIAIQIQPFSGGFTTNSTYSASFVGTSSISFVPDYTYLEGTGYSVGGSFFSNYYGLGGGADINIFPAKKETYYGWTISGGVGVPSGEAHADWGPTTTIAHFNIYDTTRKVIKSLRSLLK